MEKFHQPLALWHPSGHYIIAAAAYGFVYVFHVGSAKVMSYLPHTGSMMAAPCPDSSCRDMAVAAIGIFAKAHAHLLVQAVHNFKAHEKNVRAMSYDSDEQTLMTGSFDRKCQVWHDRAPRAQIASEG